MKGRDDIREEDDEYIKQYFKHDSNNWTIKYCIIM